MKKAMIFVFVFVFLFSGCVKVTPTDPGVDHCGGANPLTIGAFSDGDDSVKQGASARYENGFFSFHMDDALLWTSPYEEEELPLTFSHEKGAVSVGRCKRTGEILIKRLY